MCTILIGVCSPSLCHVLPYISSSSWWWWSYVMTSEWVSEWVVVEAVKDSLLLPGCAVCVCVTRSNERRSKKTNDVLTIHKKTTHGTRHMEEGQYQQTKKKKKKKEKQKKKPKRRNVTLHTSHYRSITHHSTTYWSTNLWYPTARTGLEQQQELIIDKQV